jgi:hypothetical protein
MDSAGILEQSMGARNRVGIGLSHWPARLHRQAESISRNRFLGSLKVFKKIGTDHLCCIVSSVISLVLYISAQSNKLSTCERAVFKEPLCKG